jgi:hypothetical protein
MTRRNGIGKKGRKFLRLCLYRKEQAQVKKTMFLAGVGINGINRINGIKGIKPPLPISHQPAPAELDTFLSSLSFSNFSL